MEGERRVDPAIYRCRVRVMMRMKTRLIPTKVRGMELARLEHGGTAHNNKTMYALSATIYSAFCYWFYFNCALLTSL
jgi:hypothetical protein